MRKLLMKAGVPLVAGAVVLSGLSGAAFASVRHPAITKPTFDVAYEGPLSGGNAQLGLNMAYAVQYAINQANAGKSQFGKLPFTLKYVGKDDQGSPTLSPPTPRSSPPTPRSSPSSAPPSRAQRRRLSLLSAHTTWRLSARQRRTLRWRTPDGTTSSGMSPTTASRDRLMPTTPSRRSI